MKTLLSSLLFAIPFTGFCQSASIDISFSPGISDVVFQSGDRSFDAMLRNSEVPKFNWSAGVHYNKSFTPALHLRFGIEFASMGSKGKNLGFLKDSDDYEELFHFPTEHPEQVDKLKFAYDHRYLCLPISLRYEFMKGHRLQPYIESGIVPAFYLNSTYTQITNLDRQSEVKSYVYYYTLIFGGSISAGLQYVAHPQIQLFAQPTFRYFTAVQCDVIEEHLLSVGVELGVRKSL